MKSIINEIFPVYDDKLRRIMKDCTDFEDELFFKIRDPRCNILIILSDLLISK